MQKLLSKNYLLAGLTVIAIMVAVPFVVNAQSARALEVQGTEKQPLEIEQTTTIEQREAVRLKEVEITKQERLDAVKTTVAEKREAAQTRLGEVKLKVCQKREKTIGNIMARMSDRGVKHLEVFAKIADRTKAFYVKSGKVLSNYEVLVAEVDATKAEAQAAVDVIKNTTTTFACDGTDPKGAANSFRASLEDRNQALKAYKTAVKNLIVGVKSVQGTTTSDTKQTEGSQQ